MAEQNTPFDSAQNFGHEKLKIKSKIILKRESKIIKKITLKGLWLKKKHYLFESWSCAVNFVLFTRAVM